MIYLYLKTHNVSGLKYLGQTKHNPFKYNGSGVVWKKHLMKYGKDITTEILAECESQEEIRDIGMYYSDKWDVVNNSEFANLQEESGQGATPNKPLSDQHRQSISKGMLNSEKYRNRNFGLKGKDNPMYGVSRPLHTAKKVSYNGCIYNSCRELAKSLNVSPATISGWIKQGKVQPIKVDNEASLFD